MTSTSIWRKAPPLSLFVLLVMLLSMVIVVPVGAEGAPLKPVPGYPIAGCYDVEVRGTGMWSGSSGTPLSISVPGPVVDAYLVWIGTEDIDAPNSPNESDLTVNGTTVIGQMVDRRKYGPRSGEWFMWRADVGPNGYNLVQQGANSYTISGWAAAPDDNRRNGASLVVVYSTGACTSSRLITLTDEMDWYWENTVDEGTTGPVIFQFEPMLTDRTVTLFLNHAGTDHTNPCRPENLWGAWGAGTPPDNIIKYGMPSQGVNGGQLLAKNPFGRYYDCGTTTYPPVVEYFGGYVGAEWAVTRLKLTVPAGATWLAVQGESVDTGASDIHDMGESGAWFVQASIPLANPELRVSKTDGLDTAAPGDTLTYTIDYENYGYGPAANTVILDTLPARVTYVSATNGGVYDSATHTVKWDLGTLNAGASGQVAVTVRLDPVFPAGVTTLTNRAVISTATPGDTNPADDVSTDDTSVTAQAELDIAKTAAPEPVDAGSELTYSVDWTVGGNAYAEDVTIVDTLPQEVAFVSATNGGVYDAGAHTVTWLLGTVTPAATGSYEVTVEVASPLYNGTTLTNAVVITDKAGDSADDSFTSTVSADHALTLDKADAPDPVAKGAELTYTLTWGVTGNEPADGVVLTDPLPFGTQFVSASDGGLYDAVMRIVTWDLGDRLPGDSGSVTLVVKVNPDFPNGINIENRATISDAKPGKEQDAVELTNVLQTPEGTIGDTVWYDNNRNGLREPGEPGLGGVTVTLWLAGADGVCSADDTLVATKVTDPNGNYLFTGVATGVYCVRVDDATLPAGVTLVSGVNPHGPIALTEGENYLKADFGYAGDQAIGDRVWSDANGNGVQDPGEVGIGGVTLDLLSAGADGKCGTADDSVVASTVTNAAGAYLFTGMGPGVYCVRVTDTAGVLTGLTQTGGVNPHGPITLGAGQSYLDADFGYQGQCVSIGDLVFYDANRNGVYEPGPNERGIPGVTLNLVAPGVDGVLGTADDVVVATTTTGANGAYLFSGLVPGSYWVVVTDLNNRLLGYTQTYGAPNANNNGQVSPYPVTIDACGSVLTADFGYADGHILTVTKTNNLPAGQPVEAGAELEWIITYAAAGREAAPNAVLTDYLPLQVDFISCSDSCVYDPATRTVKWNLGDLQPGDTGTRTLKVKVKRPLPNASYIFNTVVILDDAGVRDEATDAVRVRALPKLRLTKINDPAGAVKPGDTIKYTLCFGNTGNGNATDVRLIDPIPANTTYVPGSASGGAVYNEAAQTLTWDLGTLAVDQEDCRTFSVKVNMTIVGLTGQAAAPLSFAEWTALTIDNVATLTSKEVPDLTASASNPLDATVRPEIYKSVNKSQVWVAEGHQETIVFTVRLTNSGTANASNVVITDMIHPKLVNVTATTTQGTAVYDSVTRVLTVTVGELAPGAEVVVTITGKTAPVAPGTPVPFQYLITNTATVSFAEGAPRESNEVSVTVRALAPEEIPEPGTLLLFGGGLAGLAGYARMRMQARRRKNN